MTKQSSCTSFAAQCATCDNNRVGRTKTCLGCEQKGALPTRYTGPLTCAIVYAQCSEEKQTLIFVEAKEGEYCRRCVFMNWCGREALPDPTAIGFPCDSRGRADGKRGYWVRE